MTNKIIPFCLFSTSNSLTYHSQIHPVLTYFLFPFHLLIDPFTPLTYLPLTYSLLDPTLINSLTPTLSNLLTPFNPFPKSLMDHATRVENGIHSMKCFGEIISFTTRLIDNLTYQ